ncbi:MAG: phosphate acyltransferase PlsX [Oscillospiraceae bacterium]
MKIIVDAMSGDNAPLDIIKGCIIARKEYNIDILLVGNKTEIEKCCKSNNLNIDDFEIEHCEDVMKMEDVPTELLKSKKKCSMAVAFNLLNDGKGEAVVLAGNTGAVLVGGTFIIKRIKGVKRVALAPIIPSFGDPFVLMDAGANIDCRPEMLSQFAIMGSIYMEKILKIKKPKVGLLNIGAEDNKGRDLEIESYQLLKNANINFYGNIEPRDIPMGKCDVVVTDGFTGNVALKLIEGMGLCFGDVLKKIFFKNLKSKIAALMVKNDIKYFKSKMDYKEQGGAILLGVKKPVIKAHGSSDERAFKNAIRQAVNMVTNNVIEEIEKSLQ